MTRTDCFTRKMEVTEDGVTFLNEENKKEWLKAGRLLLYTGLYLERDDVKDTQHLEEMVEQKCDQVRNNLYAALRDLGYDIGQA